MISREDPLSVWREQIGRRLLSLDFRPLSDVPFQAKIVPILQHDGLRVIRWTHTPGAVFRDASLVMDDSIGLIYPVAGTMNVSQQGRQGRLGTGDATLLRHCEPGEVGSHGHCNLVALVLPAAALALREGDSDRLFTRRWSRDSDALRLLKAYLSLLERGSIRAVGELGAIAARHVIDLVRLAAHEQCAISPDIDPGTIASARLRVVLAIVEEQFRDPELSVASVAARLPISQRYMHKLFEQAGVHFTGHVNTLRLDAAHRDLTDPGSSSRTVADIAFAAGFSDISHFNRLFRRRFGATPTSVR